MNKQSDLKKCRENIALAINNTIYLSKTKDDTEFEMSIKTTIKIVENNLRQMYKLRHEESDK